MNLLERPNRKGDKIYYHYDYGRGPGQRPATGVFTYVHPKNQTEKNHNKEALALLDVKKSQLTIEQQAIGSAYIPSHKIKTNFLDYYKEYVDLNKRDGNRHLSSSLTQFKLFLGKDFIAPVDITENLCKRFRQFLLDKFTGETPANYFSRFKSTLTAAENDKYFYKAPSANVAAKGNPSARLKENLEIEDYLALLNTPNFNEEVKAAFIFSCYTGLRWVDNKKLEWADIKDNILTTRIIQAKTGRPVTLTLHPIARAILDSQKVKMQSAERQDKFVFSLPTADGANRSLESWVKAAGIEKYITWSCARLSFSILLQDEKIDDATVAYLMGHASTAQVRKTYKRHRPKNQTETISHLPSPVHLPHFLK